MRHLDQDIELLFFFVYFFLSSVKNEKKQASSLLSAGENVRMPQDQHHI